MIPFSFAQSVKAAARLRREDDDTPLPDEDAVSVLANRGESE